MAEARGVNAKLLVPARKGEKLQRLSPCYREGRTILSHTRESAVFHRAERVSFVRECYPLLWKGTPRVVWVDKLKRSGATAFAINKANMSRTDEAYVYFTGEG